MLRTHDPQVLVLMETRVGPSRAADVVSKLGFSDSTRVDAEGFSGGILILWRQEQVRV